jgi:hypothetical protein
MTLLAHCGARKITRAELKEIPTPAPTRTHQPLAHYAIVEALIESLAFRNLNVVRDEYAVSQDGMKMFGSLDLALEERDFRFSIGIRNANDKSMRFAMTVGIKVFVCDNLAFRGDFTPVFHKHTRKLELLEIIALGVDKIQRGFAPLRDQVELWQTTEISAEFAKLIIYDAFLKARLAPRHLLPLVDQHYFQPKYEAFAARTFWSLSNAFTSAFKQLLPVRQFQATAKLGDFLQGYAGRAESPLHLVPSSLPPPSTALATTADLLMAVA